MAIVFNNTTLKWYEDTIVFNGSTVSSPDSPGDVFFGDTQVHGLTDFASETILHAGINVVSNGQLAPDSNDIESFVKPILEGFSEAFWSQGYTDPPGGDVRYEVYLKPGYKIYSPEDGTFVGSASPGTRVYFYSGSTVTGINTSHNGRTNWYLIRDDGF
jgi:hypothetical protein